MIYLILIFSFFLLIKSADIFCENSSAIAKKFGIPSFIIGMTLVSISTSLPELTVSITSALNGLNDMSVANVTGSNLFNLLCGLGISAIITKLKVDKDTTKQIKISIISSLLLVVSVAGLYFSRLEGLVFLVVFGIYMYSLIKNPKSNSNQDFKMKHSLVITVLLITLSVIGIVVGGDLLVESASQVASQLGMSDNLIGLTVVAVGTSAPEFATSIMAIRKGDNGLALGNIIGSNIFNILFVLGVSSMISPMSIGFVSFIDAIVLLVGTALFFIVTKDKGELKRWHGIVMVLSYVIYIIYTIIR